MVDQASGLRKMVAARKRADGPALRVYGVTSGKGGVGKTHLTTNLAVMAAREGKRVLVLDGDAGMANVEILYGMTPRHHLGHLLDGQVGIREVLAEGPHGVRILPAGSGVQSLTRLTDDQKLRLTHALDQLEDDFDVVFIDSGAGITDNVLFFVGASQQALLVVSPEPTSLTDAYAAVKVLSVQAGMQDFGVVVNQAPSEAHAREIFQRLTLVSGRFLNARMSYLGFVPRDENVHRAAMAQRPLVELFPHSPASRALAVIQAKLDEAAPPPPGSGLKFLWHRLLRESTAGAR